jgi:hypothetical protein
VPTTPKTQQGPSHTDAHPDPEEHQALDEYQKPTVSKPGAFRNDPDDPTNPNEAVERARRRVKP